jgi:hypothetical protein
MGVSMKHVQKFLATALLAAVSVLSVQAFSAPEGHASARRQCYWVKGVGVVCDTPDDTITL